jgi:hypothetical protein
MPLSPRQRTTLLTGVSLLASLGSACTTVRPIQPALFIPRTAPDVVWVTAADNTVVPVAAPEVAGDTLRGMRRGTSEPIAIPLISLQTVKAKVPDHAKTALLLVGMGALATATVYAIWISKAGPHAGSVDCGVYDSENDGPGGAPRPYC